MGIPKAITAIDVQRLLDSCDISDPAGVRDYAVLMLVARLGLRSIEDGAAAVGRPHWGAGRIVLRGKASRDDGMPLPADVGEALSAYLRQARPATGEPPGVSAAVLVGVAVNVEPCRGRARPEPAGRRRRWRAIRGSAGAARGPGVRRCLFGHHH
jgi:integrase